eukprot:3577628-Rhodomonas_salina.1
MAVTGSPRKSVKTVKIGPNQQSVTDQFQNSAIHWQETEPGVGRVGLYKEIARFCIAYARRQFSENAQINHDSVCRLSIPSPPCRGNGDCALAMSW